MRLLEKSIIVIILSAITNVISLIISIFFARTLITTDFGRLQTFFGFTTLAFNFINLGITQAVNKIILHKKKNNEYIDYIFNGLFVLLVVFCVFLLFSLFFLENMMGWLDINSELTFLVQLSIGLTFFNLMNFFFLTNLISAGKNLKNSLLVFINIIIYIGIIIFLFLNTNLTIQNILIGRIISFVLVTIPVIFYFINIKKPVINLSLIKEILNNTELTLISVVIITLTNFLVKPILGIISLEQVAYYSVALNYGQIIIFFQTGIKSIMFPLIGKMAINKEKKRINTGFNILFNLVLKIVLPLSLILVIFSSDIIKLVYTENYATANRFVLFITIGAVLNFLSLPEVAVFSGFNKLKDRNYYQLLKAIIYLPLFFMLVSWFSGIGASISYLVLSIISLILFLIFLKKYGFKIEIKKLYYSIVPILIITIYFVTNIKIIPSILLIIYSFISFKFGIISKQTKNYIIKLLRDRKINENIIKIIS